MYNEIYLNHPTFGLLYQICLLDDNKEIFTTLYAQRLFFLVKTFQSSTQFEPITRGDARLLIENRLRVLRRTGDQKAYKVLESLYRNSF